MAGLGLAYAFSRVVFNQTQYQYILRDDTGSEITDPKNNHRFTRTQAEREWTIQKGQPELVFNGSDIQFGPAETSWGNVGELEVRADVGNGFELMGIVDLPDNKTVGENEIFVIDDSSNDIAIDLSASSDTPSSGEFPALWRSMLRYHRNTNASWRFTLGLSSGTHDSIVKSNDDVSWSFSTSGLTYEGDEIQWRVITSNSPIVNSGATVQYVEVFVKAAFDFSQQFYSVARVSSITNEDTNGNSHTPGEGDKPKLNSGEFTMSIT